MNPGLQRNAAASSKRRIAAAIMAATATAVATLALTSQVDPASAAFPGANGKIAFDRFLSSTPFERKAIFVIKPDGSGLRKLAAGAQPNWSADGKKIVFTRRGKGGVQSIYVMRANGTDVRRLTNKAETMDHMPVWSPNGKKVAFVRQAWPEEGRQPPGPGDIYIMDANGEHLRRLTKTPARNEDTPDWSPSGKRIAYAGSLGDGTRYGVITIKTDGTGKRLLSSPGDQPDWSPDGTQIAFDRDGQIYVMTARGTKARPVGPGADLNGNNAAWSPSGKKIAFVGFHPPGGTEEGFIGIFTMNADGSKIAQLTVGGRTGEWGLNDSSPDWQPR